MPEREIVTLRSDTPAVLDNVTCWYCGRDFHEPGVIRTREHTIARRFVPKGKLDRQWNLIGWACTECNGRKADLENDLSAISMQPDAFGRYADGDAVLKSEAARKAINCFSRRTSKPVKESAERFLLKVPFAPGVDFEFTATTSPQPS